MTYRSILLGSAALLSLPCPAFAQSAAQPASSQRPAAATEPAAASAPPPRRSRSTTPATRRRSSSLARVRAARSSATFRRKTRSTLATSEPPARPASPTCSTHSRRRSEARAAAAASAGAAAQRPADLGLPRASRHPDRSDPAGRDPARGSGAQIWLSRRPEGGEHRPSPALPFDHRAGRRGGSRPTAAMRPATPTSRASWSSATGRTTLNLHARRQQPADRGRAQHPADPGRRPPERPWTRRSPPARWSAATRDVRGSATFNRTVFGNVSGTLNTELEHSEGRSLIGLNPSLLEPLAREHRRRQRASRGVAQRHDKSQWRWTVTSNADLDATSPARDRNDPSFPTDRSRSTTTSGDLKATANGNLFKLPAGDASTTLTLGGSTVHLDQHRGRGSVRRRRTRCRARLGEAAINLDLPISRRNRDFSALGNLTLNANAEVDQLSDFGTLTTIGAGANWSPVDRLNFIASWTREEGPPTINQLGDPVLDTPGSRIFDFTTGQTVLVDAITGGNPNLKSDRRNVLKLGANWQPFDQDRPSPARRLCPPDDRPADLEHQRHAGDRGRVSRSLRRATRPGQLVRVDLRPVNFDSARARHAPRRLRFLQAAQVAAAVAGGDRPDPRAIRLRRPRRGPRAGRVRRPGSGRRVAPAGAATRRTPRRRRLWRRTRRRRRRRLLRRRRRKPRPADLSLTDTITFVDKVAISPGRPELDYLHGDAAGSDRRHAAAPGRGPGRLVEQRPRRAARRQLAQRDEGQHADRRRPPLLAARRRSTSGCSPIPATSPRSRSSIRGCAARRSGWRSTTSSTAARRCATRRAMSR